MSIEAFKSQPIPAFIDMARGTLPESSETALIYLNSSSLMQLTMATGKNLPYLFGAKEFRIYDLCHALSSRANYLEAAYFSVATLVYNAALSAFYSIFVVFTLGQFESLNFSCRKHWAHLVHSGMGVGIGLLGALAPSLGGKLNFMVVNGALSSLKVSYKNDLRQFEPKLVNRVKEFFQEYKKDAFKIVVDRHPELFLSEYDDFFKVLSNKINSAQNVQDLQEVIFFVWDKVSKGKPEQEKTIQPKPEESKDMDMSRGEWSELYRFFRDINEEAWKKFPETTNAFYQMLSSSSLVQLTTSTIKNLSYVAKASEFGINDPAHFLSSRFLYLETAFTSLASSIYNLAMAIIYSGLVILTMWQMKDINYSCKTHWTHLTHSTAATATSLLGTLVPTLGVLLNLLMITRQSPDSKFYNFERSFLQLFKKTSERDLSLYKEEVIKGVKEIYSRYQAVLSKFAEKWFKTYLKIDHEPFMQHVGERIQKAQKMEDLSGLVWDIWRKFPRVHLSSGGRIGSEKPIAMFRYYEKE